MLSSDCAPILEKVKALETRKKSLQITLQTTSNKAAIIEQIESINEQISQIKSDNPHCFSHGVTIVREISKSEIYLIYNGKRMLVYDNKTELDLVTAMNLDLAWVRSVPDGSLSSIPIMKLESASLTPPSLVFPPDNQGGKFFLDVPGSIKLQTQYKEIRIVEIRGWLRLIEKGCNGTDPDWHYSLDIDPEWADSKGIDLNQILKVGNIIKCDLLSAKTIKRIPSAYAILALPSIHVELNGWRPKTTNLPEGWFYTSRPKPSDWNKSISEEVCKNYGTIWPYDPLNPNVGDSRLDSFLPPIIPDKAPYVSISGSILMDNPHIESGWIENKLLRWFGFNPIYQGTFWDYLRDHFGIKITKDIAEQEENEVVAAMQIWATNKSPTDPTNPARWTEIHPPDIIKVLPYKEPKETLRGIAVVANNGPLVGETRSISVDIYPPSPRPLSISKLEVKELVGPETNFSTIIEGNVTKSGARITTYSDRVNVYVKVQGQGAYGAPGKFKAIYRVGWATLPPPSPTPTPIVSDEQWGTRWTAKNADGTLEVFVIGSDTSLYHIWQTSPGGGWTNWGYRNGTQLRSPTVGQNADGRLEVFVIGGDGALYRQWQTSPGGGWSNWDYRGGNQLIGSNLAVAKNLDGKLEVFVIGGDGALYHQLQTSPGGIWTNWTKLGSGIQLKRDSLSVAKNHDGRIEVFAIGNDTSLYHIWQTSPGGGWTNWGYRNGTQLRSPTVGQNADGRLEVFVIGGDGALYRQWQTSPGGGWSNWDYRGGNQLIGSNLAVAKNLMAN